MRTRKQLKLINVGDHVAAVEVELIDDEVGWGPYLSLADARKLDAARQALREGNLSEAGKHGRVFKMTPVQVA